MFASFKEFNNEIISILKIKNISFNSTTSSKIDSAYLVIKETTISIPLKGIINKKNLGYAGGYNEGVKNIKADYYVFINTDVAVTNNCR